MTPEIRRAALRAAAKASLLTVVGCWGGASPAPAQPVGNDKTTETKPMPAASCDADLDKLAKGQRDDLADDDPLKQNPAVYGAFLDRKARESARTQQCCKEELLQSSANSTHRWECCSALDNQVPDGGVPSACSPWGPPNPPEYVA